MSPLYTSIFKSYIKKQLIHELFIWNLHAYKAGWMMLDIITIHIWLYIMCFLHKSRFLKCQVWKSEIFLLLGEDWTQ